MTSEEFDAVAAAARDARLPKAQRDAVEKLAGEHVALLMERDKIDAQLDAAITLLDQVADVAARRGRRVPPEVKLRRIATDAAEGARKGRETP